jgi:hypothetical protein
MQRWAEPIYSGGRRVGPEAEAEDAVVMGLRDILPLSDPPSRIFGSRRVGAGAPDLTVLYHASELASFDGPDVLADILAYLRVVGRARADTLRDRLRLKQCVLETCLEILLSAGALRDHGEGFTLQRHYREPLREVVAIEAKVSKWRDAVSQAARNRVFAHRSFVALPEAQARLAQQDERVAMLGIGVIAVSGDAVRVIKRSRRTQPRVWRYYFELYLASLRHTGGLNAVRCSDRGSKEAISSI